MSLLSAISETTGGSGMATAGGASELFTFGLSSEVSLPMVGVGTAMAVHGTVMTGNTLLNMASGPKGQLKTESSNNDQDKVKREPTAKLREKWEVANNKEWPSEPDNPGKKQTVSHKKALKDGGTDELHNIEPKPAKEHHEMHKNNGDYSRWRREFWEKKKSE